MKINTENDKISKIAEIIKSHNYIDFAYLFGSQAKKLLDREVIGISLYILIEILKDFLLGQHFYISAKIAREIDGEVNITVLNNIKSPVFLFQVISNGLLILDRNNEKRILFEAKVLNIYHDWQYILKRQMRGLVKKNS